MELKQLFTFAAACSLALSVSAQDRVHYTGTELSNPTCHDGQLSPVVGVHNIQVMRANREHPAPDNGNDGHTIISPCWLIGTDNSICIIFPILRTSIFLPHKLS